MGRFFKTRQNKFLRLICEQASLTMKGLDCLKRYMDSLDTQAAVDISNTEQEADEIRRILISELNRTFLTPIDREDIFNLSRSVDDMLDYAYSTVSEMEILHVRPTRTMQRIASLLADVAYEINLAAQNLSDHPEVASEHAQRAKALENRVEDVYREALAELFKGPKDMSQVIKIIKTREVYRHLSNAADRGDEAANVIADIVVKIA